MFSNGNFKHIDGVFPIFFLLALVQDIHFHAHSTTLKKKNIDIFIDKTQYTYTD